MKKPLLLLASLALMAYWGYQKWIEIPTYQVKSYVFGTLVDISIIGVERNRARQLADQVLSDFQGLHQRLHAWKPISENQLSALQALNQAISQQEAVTVASDLVKMLHETMLLSQQSQGLFNPAIGQLIQTWGFHRDAYTPVDISEDMIHVLTQANPVMADIVIDGQTVTSKNNHVSLDFGGYAKGYALDLAATYLRKNQVKHALINIGGNIIALGENKGRPWRVGIQHPRKPEALATVALADGWAIGTSGDYQRYFEKDGRRYCHLINPKTGYPVLHTQAVTVLISPRKSDAIQAGVLSDVASKPIFIAEKGNKAKLAKQLGVTHYLVVDAAGVIKVSEAMQNHLNWIMPNEKFETLH